MSGLAFASPGPIAVSLGPLSIRWYGLLLGGSALLGLALARREAIRRGEPLDPFMATCAYTLGGAVAGARLYHVALNLDYFGRHPLKVFALWEGGAAIFGGVAGGVLLAAVYTWRHALPLGRYLDIMTPSLVLGQAIGRWGNFFNEEAFGRPTNLPWKLYISPPHRPPGFAQFDYFHPTFLYESIWDFAVFLALVVLLRPKLRNRPGALFFCYVGLYSIGRFAIEALRLDSFWLGSFRVPQIASVVGVVIAALGLMWTRRRATRLAAS
jgi:phosphatidylglycerol:prolipoprotein diacylglycerol transferase